MCIRDSFMSARANESVPTSANFGGGQGSTAADCPHTFDDSSTSVPARGELLTHRFNALLYTTLSLKCMRFDLGVSKRFVQVE